VNDTDDEGYSDYYNRLSKFVRYGDVPSWDWERLDSEHAIATEEEKEHAQALKSFYAVLTTSDEPQE